MKLMQPNRNSSRKQGLLWLFGVLVMSMASCRAPQVQSSNKKPQPDKQQTTADERIAFYFFYITKNEKDEIQVSLKDKKIVPGKLKPAIGQSAHQGSWRFTFTDASTTPTYIEVMEDPLNPVVEYMTDAWSMAKKTISKSSAEITIRLAYNPSATQVIIEKLVNESEAKEIGRVMIK